MKPRKKKNPKKRNVLAAAVRTELIFRQRIVPVKKRKKAYTRKGRKHDP